MTQAIQRALRKKFSFNEGRVPHSPEDMIFAAGNASDALLYSLLFVPELSLVDDSVLLTNGSSEVREAFSAAKRKSQMPLERLEASFNMREIPFLFANGQFEENDENLLADKVAEAWRRALKSFCPDRRFAVNVVPAEENAGNVTVEFYELRS